MLRWEEFNDNSRNWPLVNHENIVLTKIADGNYIMDNSKSSRFWALHYSIRDWFEKEPDNLEIKTKLTSTTGGKLLGILWNSEKNNVNSFNEYSFFINNDGHFFIGQSIDGVVITLKDWTTCPDIKPDDYNILHITQDAKGMHQFYINNHAVFHINLPTSHFTTIGYYCDSHSTLSVDYLKFTANATGDPGK